MNVDIKSMPKPMKAFFNGIAQVVFIENTISGIIFFISFFIAGLEMTQWDFGSWDSWKFGIFTLIGVNLSNLTAYLMGADRDAITSGLFGFCPNLVAIAAGVFAGDAFTAWFVLLGCTYPDRNQQIYRPLWSSGIHIPIHRNYMVLHLNQLQY